jgi:5-formyltetrahydrofolate cyclo-ligase
VSVDDEMPAAKRDLRARMRAVRTAIAADSAERERRSASISAAIIGVLRTGVTAPAQVVVFDPLPTEPDVRAVADWCHAHAITTHLPQVDGSALRVDVDVALLDAVLVPGLAFTADGRRLGQGGGHFDRFLPRLRDDCVTIGVAFREQLVADLPVAAHDATVDVVITD